MGVRLYLVAELMYKFQDTQEFGLLQWAQVFHSASHETVCMFAIGGAKG